MTREVTLSMVATHVRYPIAKAYWAKAMNMLRYATEPTIWQDGADQWSITLKSQGREYRFDYWIGIGHRKVEGRKDWRYIGGAFRDGDGRSPAPVAPTVKDILECQISACRRLITHSD